MSREFTEQVLQFNELFLDYHQLHPIKAQEIQHYPLGQGSKQSKVSTNATFTFIDKKTGCIEY